MRNRPSRWGWLVVVAAMVAPGSSFAGRTEVERAWTPERLIMALEARERAITTLEAEVIDHVLRTPGQANQARRSYESLKAVFTLAKIAEQLPSWAAFTKEPMRPESTRLSTTRIWFDSGRGRRIEVVGDDIKGRPAGSGVAYYVFDGQRLHTRRDLQGSIERLRGGRMPRAGAVFGLECDYRSNWVENPEARTFSGALREALEGGTLLVSPTPGGGGKGDVVTAILRRPPSEPRLAAAGLLMEHALLFDTGLAMAPIKIVARIVHGASRGFAETFPPFRVESRWEGFVESAPGVFLPNRHVFEKYSSVIFPIGEKIRSVADLNLKDEEHYRAETFLDYREVDTVESLKVNRPIDPRQFELEFPEGTTVRDEFAGKAFHVGTLSEETREALARSVGRRSLSEQGALNYAWLFAVNIVILIAVVLAHVRGRWMGPRL